MTDQERIAYRSKWEINLFLYATKSNFGKTIEGVPPNARRLLLAALLGVAGLVNAETVNVKYRGPVDLKTFTCETVARSSLVKRVCYDQREQYMIINLQGTYYHYCEINARTVSALLGASSMGRYYLANIKGDFDCRTRRVPAYK